ncbi:Palmitoyltransferase zdhhc23 [Bulinus truncatus]|nr:Palmitoyltransferase zdhhc23 [Bulinus truncatus]
MLIGLLYQIILISQNVTSHELAHAHRQGLTRCGVFLKNNPYSRGLFRNWIEFWLMGSRLHSPNSSS